MKRYFVTEPPGPEYSFSWYVVRDRCGDRFPNQQITYYFKDFPRAKQLAYEEAKRYNEGETPSKIIKEFK